MAWDLLHQSDYNVKAAFSRQISDLSFGDESRGLIN